MAASRVLRKAPFLAMQPGKITTYAPWMQLSNRILVRGGDGFTVSPLFAFLIAAGHEVLCVDNYFTGRRRNIEHLLSKPRFEVMRHDVTFPLYVEVDDIYNLACPASPIHYQYDPVQ